MFDLRYHVASLAAVFVALIIGILVGVGISSRGVISNPERSLLNERITELRTQLGAMTQQVADLSRRQRVAETFIRETYPALMQGRLKGKRIALVFVGSIDGPLRSNVEAALADAGAPSVLRIRAIKVPIDVKALDRALARRPALAAYVGARVGDLGRALGEEFVTGGDTPLWDALAAQLVEERSGGGKRPADGVVVVRTVVPQLGATARFLAGFYAGLARTGAPAVGAESSTNAISAIDVYRRLGISSVDDVDTPTGRLALVALLAGGQPGHYGIKRTAEEGILPPIEPLPSGAVTGG